MANFEEQDFRPKPLDSELGGPEIRKITDRIEQQKRDRVLRGFDTKLAEVVRNSKALRNNPNSPDLIRALKKTRNWIWKNKQWLDYPEFVDDLFRKIGVESDSASLLIEIMTPKTEQTSDDTVSPTESPVTPETPEPAKPTFTLSEARGAEGLSKLELRTPRLELDTLEPLESPEKPEALRPRDLDGSDMLEFTNTEDKDQPELQTPADIAENNPKIVEDFRTQEMVGDRVILTREQVAKLEPGRVIIQYDAEDSHTKPIDSRDLWRVRKRDDAKELVILERPVVDEVRLEEKLVEYFKTILRKVGMWEEMSDEQIADYFSRSTTYEKDWALNDTRPFSYGTFVTGDLAMISADEERGLASHTHLTVSSLKGSFRQKLEKTLAQLAIDMRSEEERIGQISDREREAVQKTLLLLDRQTERIGEFLNPEWQGAMTHSIEKQLQEVKSEAVTVDDPIIKDKAQTVLGKLWRMITKVEGSEQAPEVKLLDSLTTDDLGKQAAGERREYLKQLEEAGHKEAWEVFEDNVARFVKAKLGKGGEWILQKKDELKDKFEHGRAEQSLLRLAIRELQPSVVDQIEQELDTIYRTYYQKSEWETFDDKSIFKNPIVKIRGLNRKFLQWQYNRGLQRAYENDLRQALIEAYLTQIGDVAGGLSPKQFDKLNAELINKKEDGGRGAELATQLSALLATKTQKERELAELIASRPELALDPNELRKEIETLKKRLLEYSQNPDYLMATKMRDIRLKTREHLTKDPAKIADLLGELEAVGMIPDTAIDLFIRDLDNLQSRFLTTKRSQITAEFGRYITPQLISNLRRELTRDESLGDGYPSLIDSERDEYIYKQIAQSLLKQWWNRFGLTSTETGLAQSSGALERTGNQRELAQKTRTLGDIERILNVQRREIESTDNSIEELTRELETVRAERLFEITAMESVRDSGTLVWNKHLYELRKRLNDKQKNYQQELAEWREGESQTAERIRSFIPDDWEEVARRWKKDRRRYGALLKRVENYQRWLDNYDNISLVDPLEQTIQFGQDIAVLEETQRQRQEWLDANTVRWERELRAIYDINPQLGEYWIQQASSGPWNERSPEWKKALADLVERDGGLESMVQAGKAMAALRSISLFAGNIPDLTTLDLRGVSSRYKQTGKLLAPQFRLTAKMARTVTTGAILLGLVGARFAQDNQQTMGEFTPSRPSVTERLGVETRNDRVSGFEVTAPISNSAFATESAGLSADSSQFELAGSQSIEDPNFEPVVIQGTPEMYEQRIDRLEAQLSTAEKTRVAQIEELYKLYLSDTEKVEDLDGADKAEEFLNQIQTQLNQLDLTGQRVASYHTTGTGMSLPVFLTEQRARLETFRSILRIYNEGAA